MAILERVERLKRDGQVSALATVVNVTGSAYRRPGARMLITVRGETVGSISGGCLEADVRRTALSVLRTGKARLLRYDGTSERDILWGLGLGCNGVVEVWVEALTPGSGADYLNFLRDTRRLRERASVATVLRSDKSEMIGSRLFYSSGHWAFSGTLNPSLAAAILADLPVLSTSEIRSYAGVDVFLEALELPVSLIVFGAGDDAVPVVTLAGALGWDVTVADLRVGMATKERFPSARRVLACSVDQPPDLRRTTAALLMTHQYLQDLAILRSVAPLDLRYLGILGPRIRTERLLETLRQEAIILPLERVHGPAGLDIGAESPQAIALSILAEIQSVLASRSGGFLKDRPGPIHASAEALVHA